MARIRTIKPGFFRSEDVSALPMRARLTWIGLWTQCDDQGRAKDNPRLIKGDIWPLDDVSLADIEEDLSTLAANGRIARYEVDGKRYLEVTNWSEHQKIDRPSKSAIPPSSEGKLIYSTNGHRANDEDVTTARAGKGKERKGKEGTRARPGADSEPSSNPDTSEPPSKCPEHQHLAQPPPCGPCADARRINAQWAAERNGRHAAAPKCRTHRGQLAANCGLCRADLLAAS